MATCSRPDQISQEVVTLGPILRHLAGVEQGDGGVDADLVIVLDEDVARVTPEGHQQLVQHRALVESSGDWGFFSTRL